MNYLSTSSKQGLAPALLISLVSLPILGSLLDLGTNIPRGLPSALGLSLLFVHLFTLPAIAWIFAYRQTRGWRSQREIHLARFGANRMRFAIRAILRRAALLSALGYLLSAVAISLSYGRLGAELYGELSLIVPVVAVWSLFLMLFFQTVRTWTHKLGLWLSILCYPIALAIALPVGPSGRLGGVVGHGAAQLFVSPLFHVAHLLGALAQHHPFPAWISLATLGIYSLILLGLLMVRVPS